MRARAVLLAYTAGWSLVRVLPAPAAYGLFSLVADTAWRRGGRGVRRLESNLARVTGRDPGDPELRALSRRAMRSYLRYWCDTFRLPDWDRARVVDAVRVEGREHLFGNLDAGRGVVAALPHMGNWDHAGAWATHVGAPVTTVAERLRPEELYERFLAYREGLGMEVLPLTGGDRSPSDVLRERLLAGRGVCLLGDRDLTRRGIDVDFFGDTARMPAGPALLAATTGAALLPIGLWFTPGGWGIRVHDEVPIVAGGPLRDRVRSATQQVADAFAQDIAARPEDWHMLQRLWLADLPTPRPGG